MAAFAPSDASAPLASRAPSGAVHVDTTGDLWLRASHGNTTLGAAEGAVEITADHGQIRVGTVTGDAILKASYGTILVGESGGEIDAKLSYGDLEITKALASVSAKTAYGNIHLREVSSGSIQVESAANVTTLNVPRSPGRSSARRWTHLALITPRSDASRRAS